MKYIKPDLPDHLKLYIKIILLQYAHTGNIRQKGADFEWFRESLKHLGCCAILWQNLLLPLQPGKVFFCGGSRACLSFQHSMAAVLPALNVQKSGDWFIQSKVLALK